MTDAQAMGRPSRTLPFSMRTDSEHILSLCLFLSLVQEYIISLWRFTRASRTMRRSCASFGRRCGQSHGSLRESPGAGCGPRTKAGSDEETVCQGPPPPFPAIFTHPIVRGPILTALVKFAHPLYHLSNTPRVIHSWRSSGPLQRLYTPAAPPHCDAQVVVRL